jgi:hypothetical protein
MAKSGDQLYLGMAFGGNFGRFLIAARWMARALAKPINRPTRRMMGFAEPSSGRPLRAGPVGSTLRAAPLIPAHAGIQTEPPRSQGRSEIYGLLCNSDAAVQPRKDSHSMESPD